jgi:CheY-like chemotaxis protein
LRMARERQPALVVLDLLLPDIGGDVVARTLRQWYGPALPIVLISASGRVRQVALTLGILAYLDKPFQVDALIATVEQRLPARSPEVAAVWQATEKLVATLRRRGVQPHE